MDIGVKKTLAVSVESLENITKLEKCAAFKDYYLARLQVKLDEMTIKILNDSVITPEEREGLRRERLGLVTALEMVEQDKKSHSNTLDNIQSRLGEFS